MAKRIHGIALMPGVSRNNRLYTPTMVAEACTRLQARIKAGDNPVVMRTHHGAGDDSLRVVGVVESVSLTKDGALAYDTRMADTQTAKDIAALAESQDNKAAVKVSVYGSWVGKSRMVQHDGKFVETADGIDIDKIDFTATPGFVGTTAIVTEDVPSDDPNIIAESVRPVMFSDISDDLNESYTDLETGARASSSVNAYGCVDGIDISVCAWDCQPDQVASFAERVQKILDAALTIAANGVDDSAESIDDDAMETKTPAENAVVETKEPTMATEEKPAQGTEAVAESAADKPVTPADVAAIVAEALKQTGLVKPVSESTETVDKEETKPVEETKEEPKVDLSTLKAEVAESVVAELIRSGSVKPQRKGYRPHVTETSAEDDPYSWENRGTAFAQALGAIPGDAADDDPDAA